MLSHDIDNAALAIDRMVQKVNEGARVSMSDLRGLQSNLRDQAAQARHLEAQLVGALVVPPRAGARRS